MIPCSLLVIILAAAPDSQSALEQANQALMQDDQSTASRLLERTLADDPGNADALLALARLKSNQRHFGDAIAALQKILTLDACNDDARYELALTQWRAGDSATAQQTLNMLLERHPQNIPALTLREDLAVGRLPPPAPSPWHPMVRADLSVGYDSNIALDPGTGALTSRTNAGVLGLDLAGTLTYNTGDAPLTLIARLVSEKPIGGSTDAAQVLPTVVEVGGMYSQHLGAWLAGFDARYQELFTDTFNDHRQRELAPSVWAAIQLGPHRVRGLVGAELRQPYDLQPEPRDNLTGKAFLRDEMVFRPVLVLIDLGGRLNRGVGTEPPAVQSSDPLLATPLYGFVEGDVDLYVKTRFWQDFALFALAAGQFRHFDGGLKESTYQGQAGLQWTFHDFELHAEYAYSRNLSDAARSYQRHQVFGGVRVWYQ